MLKMLAPKLIRYAAWIFTLSLARSTWAAESRLASEFVNPPVSAHPQVWWDWMNGNVTKAGITADLEAMHRIGIVEANIITVSGGIPAGDVPVMSPKFFDMVEFSAKEAQRLNMTLSMDNCPGWSSSGGPWVTPEHAMQFITTSQTTVHGPLHVSQKLEQPTTKKDFYRDIAVLAFKTPAGMDNAVTPDNPPKASTNVPGVDVSSIVDPKAENPVALPTASKEHPFYVQVEFSKPVFARTILLDPGKIDLTTGTLQTSDDGTTFTAVCPFTLARNSRYGLKPTPQTVFHTSDGVRARFFRFNFEDTPAATAMSILSIRFASTVTVTDISAKSIYNTNDIDSLRSDHEQQLKLDPSLVIQRQGIVDLTKLLKPDGSLEWNAPEGDWTILRIGYTPTGATNHPAPPEAKGLECDKLSPEGLDASWNGMMKPILNRLGPLGGKALVDCQLDSYEAGGQNWTPRMVEYFIKLRGYDPTPYLPVITGRIIDSPAVSERFLWDLRRTIADLFAQNYVGHFTELCHQAGMKSLVEPYQGPFESLQCGGQADVPMGEFWAGGNGHPTIAEGHPSVRMIASVGHIYGQKIIAAESFTGQPDHGRWADDPYSLKALGDLMYCRGINKFIFHRFAHQPWLNRSPGMTMGKWGINFDRTNTWFELAKPWMGYLSRCQYMLQQGRSVEDVAYFSGQSTPVMTRENVPALPRGFSSDSINAEILMRASVIDHRITLPSGASYALLVLPAADPQMSPDLLQKIRDLVYAGAWVLGGRPDHSPGLTGYPQCDQTVKLIADELWGDCDGKTVTAHNLGSGRITQGKSLQQIFSEAGLTPDFTALGLKDPDDVNYAHRKLEQGDIYFVTNHADRPAHYECTFRVGDKVPELWHPDTGRQERVPAYEVKGGHTIVPLDLDPSGSVFVVFNETHAAGDYVVRSLVPAKQPMDLLSVDGPWQLKFPPNLGTPPDIKIDHLMSWPEYPDRGVRYFSGTATYIKDINLPANAFRQDATLDLDLGDVKNLAQVQVNGVDLGILWKPPFKVDMRAAAKPGVNHLEIKITNLWPNRLIGDAQLPEDTEWQGNQPARWPKWLLNGEPSPTDRLTFATWRHFSKQSPLLPSGLLGPVKISLTFK